MKRFLVPVSTVSARNAWHNDPRSATQTRQKSQGGTSRKIGWGCAARFLKPLPYFRPKSVIFPTLFRTNTLLWNSSNTTENALCSVYVYLFSYQHLYIYWVYSSDIDECDAANNSCHENAWCNNTQGSFTCSCKPGYEGDGYNCTGKIL